MDQNDLLTMFSILFGLVLGSFLNVCIHRIPRMQSIVRPPSSCPQCGTRIRWHDNIPLISYLLLLGRCRNCRKTIPLHYPIVELITALLSLALFMRYGPSLSYLAYLLFVSSLIVISFIDLHHQIIPNILSIPGALLGPVTAFFQWSSVSLHESLIGMVGGGLFFFLIAFLFRRIRGKEGMGQGDIKLLAMIGAWMGWRILPFVILVSSLTGTVIGGGALLVTRKEMGQRIPFGPFLVLGALICLFFGQEIGFLFSRFQI